MIHIPRWKVILILTLTTLGLLYAAPNLFPFPKLPAWGPGKTVNLGLDLRGGAYLLYDVDLNTLFADHIDNMAIDLRATLKKEEITFESVSVVPNGVEITLMNATYEDAVRQALRRLDAGMEITQDGLTFAAHLSLAAIKDITDKAMDRSIEIVRRRVDELGTTEPSIQRQGDNRILLQVPGASAQELKRIVGKTAKLGFHLVEENSTRALVLPYVKDPAHTLPVGRRAIITGDMLTGAQPSFDQNGQPVVSFALNTIGAKRFCQITRQNVGRPFAIVLDGQVISAPSINEPICAGSGQISGGFTVKDTQELSLLLRAGALPAPMTVVEERTIGPSLGADSVRAGWHAGILGVAFVIVLIVLIYGILGIMASIALLVNVALIFALLSILQATLTLPGIAGIVLTIGLAVDANVLVFERLREEQRAGRSVLSSIDSGYTHAMSAITDSNLTTLIAAFILFSFGTGPVKGFAVTLGIGIATSLFAAIMLTRLMLITWVRRGGKI